MLGVLNYLQALVDNSGIVAELSVPGMSYLLKAHKPRLVRVQGIGAKDVAGLYLTC